MTLPVPESINFSGEEEAILAFWKEIDAFNECAKIAKGRPHYSFYDGPPFATGMPHYGHILAGTIKDIVTRYYFQNGYNVERRFGWDTHGLPVEFEIDKKLGIKGPEDVKKMGIAAYNKECRSIVMRYSSDWETVINRIGRWIDFKNDYKTLYPWFMESVWWVFSQLWNKGLVYRGVKVMPFSTGCSTPLSNFESGQNYKEVLDPCIVPMFQSRADPTLHFIAWTTTPWTLPSNLALCVNPELLYVILLNDKTGIKIVMMEARMGVYFQQNDGKYCRTGKKDETYSIVKKCKGQELGGMEYVPLFPYFSHFKHCFRVLMDSYVTEESGTGIVHQAPYFGEDDYRVCLNHKLITKDQDPICPIDDSGKFVSPVEDFKGLYVKEADSKIIALLKEQKKVFDVGQVNHNYPFCWRSETPLIYRAVPSWFIRVQHMSESLLKCNDETYWVPEFVKEKRFGNWLREARDWSVSRNRYWGTPIPLWVSEDFEEIVCVSSIQELEELTRTKITDLHRESIDHLTIPSKRPGGAPLKRISEVFDCWFESGSMPYAQIHYPFENKELFEQRFPADFIAEGIDQTRGWFYTLLVISTLLFKKPPFKNLIASGLVLAADGQKMSKSKKNYPDPMLVVNKFGADALRMYLINSPVVRADKLKFREEGVRDILKDVFLPWYNAYRFFIQNVEKIKKDNDVSISFSDDDFKPKNLMDQWILSFTQSLVVFVRKEMAAYRLYTVVPRLVQFIDNLTNWYVRMNRRRLKGENGVEDCKDALCTLGSVLSYMIRLMAPYTPFLTELIFKNIKILTNRKEKSVHHVMMPHPRQDLINEGIEKAVSKMQTVIDLGRVARDRRTIPVKYPLKEIVVILESAETLKGLEVFKSYILEELNVKEVKFSLNKQNYGLVLRAEPDHKTLGPRLKDKFKSITNTIKNLSDAEIEAFKKKGEIEIDGETIVDGELRVMLTFKGEQGAALAEKFEANVQGDVSILLDITPDEEMLAEGTAREVINRVQKLRKKAHLVPTDEIEVYYVVNPQTSDLTRIAAKYTNFIENTLKVPFIPGEPKNKNVIIQENQQLKSSDTGELNIFLVGPSNENGHPACRFANVHLHESLKCSSNKATVILENPVGHNKLNCSDLKFHVQNIFGLFGQDISLFNASDGKPLTDNDLLTFSGNVVAAPKCLSEIPGKSLKEANQSRKIVCKFTNVAYESQTGTVLLENPSNFISVSKDDVNAQAARVFSSVSNGKIDVRKINVLS
uniref:Isoleucine--tRNA ligase, cytoplasmic n=1 Tax=Lygus hesperus TaxID=30085 RepID=A0A0A9VWV1_LYGHE